MQACVDWVLKIFGTQVTKKKRPVRPVFPNYLSVSFDYGGTPLIIFWKKVKDEFIFNFSFLLFK